jgi:hypothetical protein
MTPSEKARRLYKLFMSAVGSTAYSWEKEQMWNYDVKKCCHIAVDEIIQHIESSYINEGIIYGSKLYWQEVKQEIEKQ